MHVGGAMFFTDYSMSAMELARTLEERGFESVWAPEHSHIPLSRKTRPACVTTSMLSSSARASAGSSTVVCPERHDVPGPAHRRGRVDRHHLAGHQPIAEYGTNAITPPPRNLTIEPA
jgi:hypothetical protein